MYIDVLEKCATFLTTLYYFVDNRINRKTNSGKLKKFVFRGSVVVN